MADDGSVQSTSVWPLPKFYFSVKWGDQAMSFQEVSGLDTEAQIIEYRHGDNPVFSTIKMPGIVKTGNVTMKKGVFLNDNKFWVWYNQIKMNTIKRLAIDNKPAGRDGQAYDGMDFEERVAYQNYGYRPEIRRQRSGRRDDRDCT